MTLRLYVISVSNPAHAARGMLRHKRLDHRLVMLMPGIHPLLVRAAGFSGWTVPALEIDGRRVQGSRPIARALEELRPEPPLFPADPAARAAVEEAEEWGERELQPVPRRLFRWAFLKPELRRWLASDVLGLPAPRVAAALALPAIRRLAAVSEVSDAAVRRDLERLPALLDHADGLIAAGVIGGEQLNAADFQIGATVGVLRHASDLRDLVDARPCAELGRRVVPRYPGVLPPALPPEWLPS